MQLIYLFFTFKLGVVLSTFIGQFNVYYHINFQIYRNFHRNIYINH